jgi:hypothetical protein
LPPGMKRCTGCQQVLPVERFGKHMGKADHLASRCKPCASAATTTWKKANPDQVRETRKQARQARASTIKARNLAEPPSVTVKRCSRCDEVKESAEFHRDISQPDGLQRRCKKCRAIRG